MISVKFVPAGTVTKKESAERALANWANECERKLLGLHCGQMLDRTRHRAWAAEKIKTAKHNRSVSFSPCGFIDERWRVIA